MAAIPPVGVGARLQAVVEHRHDNRGYQKKYDRDRTQLIGLRTEVVTGWYYVETVRKNQLYCGSKMYDDWNDKKGRR